MIQYYRKIEFGLTLDNPEVIPLLLHMRWFGQSTAEDIHLKIYHPCGDSRRDNIIWSMFHKILWDDVDDSNNSSFRRARLRLEGKQYNDKCKEIDIFAMVDLDMGRPKQAHSIIFSPISFGTNGKPDLSRSIDNLESFLETAKMIFSCFPVGTVWNDGTLSRLIREKVSFAVNDTILSNLISPFEDLRVIECIAPEGYKLLMSGEQFEEIFGVKF